ncbi:MAG TPA: hypothetical protein VE631_03285, partial [Alphaproteobacteria bacterium]|nr:hypothetical protein [Alphaproteobacteria bacterium]
MSGISGLALVVVVLATILREVAGLAMAGEVAAACLASYVLLQAPRLPRAGKLILLVAMAVGLGCLGFVGDPAAVAGKAARTGSYYATLFTAVGFLRAAAEGSPMIRRCGRHMMAQPPTRRYAALTLGANLFGLILSFGTLHLLGTMVKRANTLAAAGGDARVQAVRARRLFTAVLRGFAMSPGWSPLSISLAVSLSVTPGAHWEGVLPLAFVTAMALLALGWLMDVVTAPRVRPRAPGPAGGGERWTVHLRLIALIAFIFVVAVVLEKALAIRLLDGVILSVPVIAVVWIALQGRRRGAAVALALTGRRIARQVREVFPTYR